MYMFLVLSCMENLEMLNALFILLLQASIRGDYYQHQQQQYYNQVMSHNTQSMQNLNLQHQMPYNHQTNQHSQNLSSPNYKGPVMAHKMTKKVGFSQLKIV